MCKQRTEQQSTIHGVTLRRYHAVHRRIRAEIEVSTPLQISHTGLNRLVSKAMAITYRTEISNRSWVQLAKADVLNILRD